MAALALEVVPLLGLWLLGLLDVRRPGSRPGLPSVFLQTQRRRLSDIVASPSGSPLFARQPWHLTSSFWSVGLGDDDRGCDARGALRQTRP